MKSDTSLTFGDFTIDRADERLLGPHGPVKLGHKAYRVLLLLAEQQGRLLTKDALFSSVWDGTIVSESALTSVIKELRRALGDESRTPRYIESVYGRGYRFLPEVVSGASFPELPAAEAPVELPPQRESTRLGNPPLLSIPEFDDRAIRDAHPHLAPVLREEILFNLSRFRDIRLVSDAEAASPSAGANPYGERDYQLVVKLLPEGASVRAFPRMTRLSSQSIIWADSIELSAGNISETVEKLVQRITAAALPRLQDDLLANLPAHPRDLHDLYLLTKLKMRGQQSLAEARQTAEAWERLIRDHPTFTQAYPPLIRLYNTDYHYTGLGSSGTRERARAYELASKAVAIDPTESHLHTVKGWCHLWAGEASLAKEHLQEALQLNPYNQNRLVEVATAHMFLGDLDRAAELLERCRNLTPFATEARHEEEGLLHLLRGDFDRAIQSLALARGDHPDDRSARGHKIMSELYALLAAAASGTSDVENRAEQWQDMVAERWQGPQPLNDQRLLDWVLFHHPFQDGAKRDWLVGLLRPRLSLDRPAPPRTPRRDPPRSRSSRQPAPDPS